MGNIGIFPYVNLETNTLEYVTNQFYNLISQKQIQQWSSMADVPFVQFSIT